MKTTTTSKSICDEQQHECGGRRHLHDLGHALWKGEVRDGSMKQQERAEYQYDRDDPDQSEREAESHLPRLLEQNLLLRVADRVLHHLGMVRPVRKV